MTHITNIHLALSPRGTALIKKFEAFAADWYLCPAYKKTIGFGHVAVPVDQFNSPISLEFAEALLRQDANKAEQAVLSAVRVPLTQSQFDALVSFAFNTGAANFKGSTLLKKLNEQDYSGAASEFHRWVYATIKGKKVKLNGLVTRRSAENRLFLEAA